MPGIDTFWVGGAPAVAQISHVTVGGTLDGETFQILIGGEVVAEHTDATTVIADTVAALVAAFNLSACPYCDGLIAASNETPVVALTSEVAGMPFVPTLNAPGGSATFALTTPTASAGPHHWDSAANWSGGAVPAASDRVTVDNPTARILWGLDQAALTGVALRLFNFAMIGLRRDVCVTSADGSTWSTARPEYRDQWLDIGYSSAVIGCQVGTGSTAIGRLKLKGREVNAWVYVHDVGNASVDPGLPAVRLATEGLTDSDGFNLTVVNGLGGIGLGVDAPNLECFMCEVRILGNAKIYGHSEIDGTAELWFNEWVQESGESKLVIAETAASPLALIKMNGGTMTIDSATIITQADVRSGAVLYENGGAGIGTLNLHPGSVVDMTQSRATKTYTAVNWSVGATLKRNDLLIVTTESLPTDRNYTMALT